MVLPVSDYTQIAKEYALPNQKKSLWEQFLTGTQTAFQQQAQQVQDVYSYDISQAYANYKKQQLQLQMNEQLGAGFQQQVGSQLQTEYGTAYQDIKTQESSALANVQEAYEEAYQEGESRFAQFGQTGQLLDKAIFEFAETEEGYDFSDTTNLYKTRREGGYELFKQTKDEAGNITTELTEYGIDFYNKMLHGTENRFVEFLQESKDYEGLYDLYMANPDLYNYMVGGLEYGTREYDTTRMTKLLEQEHEVEVNLLSEMSENQNYQNYIENLSGKSTEDLRKLNTTITNNNIAQKFETIPNYGGHAKLGDGASATDVITGEKFKGGVVKKGSGDSVDIIRSVPDMKGKLKSGELTKGDIIVYNGEKYVISSYSSKYGVLDVEFIYQRKR